MSIGLLVKLVDVPIPKPANTRN